ATQQKINFTEAELSEFKDVFSNFDKNKDGVIDFSELHELTKSLGEPSSSEELAFVVKSFDTNNDGALDFQEFLSLMSTLRSVGRD
ncbi:hypothetical protein BGZ83_003433, partial [Gryganskiella cystojenkinii]